MNAPRNTDDERPTLTGPAAEALAGRRRRLVLAELQEVSRPLGLDHLTREVRARLRSAPDGPPSRDRLETALYHRDLPGLEAAGLVTRPTADRVVPADHPLLDHEALDSTALRDESNNWETLGTLVARPHRLHVVACLAEHSPRSVDGLAQAVRDRLPASQLDALPGSDVRSMLYHVDLPHLADEDVVDYDEDRQRVAPGKFPDLSLLPGRYRPTNLD